MKGIAFALLLVIHHAPVAEASPVRPPVGWVTDPGAAVSMSKRLGELPHFGGLASNPITEVYRAPQGGASLFVTRVFAAAKPEERDRAVTIELAELDAAMQRTPNAASDSGGTRALPDLKLLEGRRNWRDPSTGIVTQSRMVVAADDKQVVAVSGECVLAGDAAADVVKACTAALASLDPDIPVGTRVVLNVTADTVATRGHVAGRSSPTPTSGAPAILEGGDRPALPPMTIPNQRESDRRPVYVGFGLVLLALIFYWNRKNREKLERTYEDPGGDKKATKRDDKPRDRDADDLHAAASDEGSEGDAKSDTKEGK